MSVWMLPKDIYERWNGWLRWYSEIRIPSLLNELRQTDESEHHKIKATLETEQEFRDGLASLIGDATPDKSQHEKWITERGLQMIEKNIMELKNKLSNYHHAWNTQNEPYKVEGKYFSKHEMINVINECERTIQSKTSVLPNYAPVSGNENRCVDIGNRVIIRFQRTGKEMEVIVVDPIEKQLDPRNISTNSPIGKAILYHIEGDVVSFDTPSGKQEVNVIKILPFEE